MTTNSQKVALIIDHNQGARKALMSVLRQAQQCGETIQAGTTNEAINAANNKKVIDLIFCDATLQDKDCFELIQDLKNISSCKKAHIVLMSSHSTTDLLTRAASLGIKNFVKKPFTSRTLLLALKRTVGKSEARSAARHSPFDVLKATASLNGITVQSTLQNFSLGGCLINCSPTAVANWRVYDHPYFSFEINKKIIRIKTEIVRIERPPEKESRTVNIALEFTNLGTEERALISAFLTTFNKKEPIESQVKKTA
ncbi:MAG: response regulator [Gammaproteobacteria bacterium]|nr:response regulator [Gammaproteobacteria bacterium]